MASARRLDHLDCLRGLAVVAVIGQHLVESFTNTTWFNGGRFGVLLFFLMSGYVIPFSLEGRTLREFAIVRFFRLYPAYWASLALAMMLVRPDFGTALANTTMMQGFIGFDNVVEPYWSLLFELLFYGICMLLAFGGILGEPRKLAVLCCALLSLGALFTFGNAVLHTRFAHKDGYQFLGFMLAGAVLRREDRKSISIVCIAVTLSALVGSGAIFRVPLNGNPHCPPLALALGSLLPLPVFLLWCRQRWTPEWLRIAGLGSYSAYLLHPSVMMMLPLSLFYPAEVAGLTAVLAWASYRWIEQPSHQLGKRMAGLRPRPIEPAPAAQ